MMQQSIEALTEVSRISRIDPSTRPFGREPQLNPVAAAALDQEIQIVAEAIVARDKQSNQIKQWCITVWMASWAVLAFDADKMVAFGFEAFGLSTAQVYIASVAGAASLLCVMFFLLDLINKRNQYKFLWRSRVIHEFLNDPAGSDFVVYDPGGATDKGSARRLRFGNATVSYDEYISMPNVARQVHGLILFYGVLISVSLIPAFVVLFTGFGSQFAVSG